MVTRLFPLNVKVSVEDRSYRLGETINLTVELSPRRDMEVREARVDLVCEESWTESFSVMVPDRRAQRAQAQLFRTSLVGTPPPVPTIPKRVTKAHRESFVHSSGVFLENAQLRSGVAASYNLRLDIDTEPPPHADKATLSWRLKTTVDVAGARDITARRLLKVTLG